MVRRPSSLLVVWSCIVPLLAVPAGAEDAFFLARRFQVPGRVVDAVAVGMGVGHGPPRLVVASVKGSPPNEQRFLSVYPVLDPALASLAPAWRVEVGADVVAFDAADVRPAPGPELILLSARRLRILGAGSLDESISLPATLPLPPRTRQLSRLAFVRDWNGDGRPAALLPSLGGALLMPLDGGTPRELPIPILTDYETKGERSPVHEGFLKAEFVWPSFFLADDDGDGRPDLFALGRFGLRVFRAGPNGLAASPSRTARFRPFSFEEERRHESNSLRAFARDLDGDGRADLVVHRTGGSLLHSRASTAVFHNGGAGADPMGPPSATLEEDGAFGSIQLADLEGDGRTELIQTAIPFGVVQLVRLLVRQHIEAKLSVYRFASPGDRDLEQSWQTDLDYPLDFNLGRVVGLLPTVEGDWNGDGVRDLLYGDGPRALAIRLGVRSDDGPGFGPPVARLELPVTDQALVADLDGDGLDDLVTYDPVDRTGRFIVAWNRGRLPGSPPRMRATGR